MFDLTKKAPGPTVDPTLESTDLHRRKLLGAGFSLGAISGASLLPQQVAASTTQGLDGDWVSVKTFGAVGDGVTDDTDAIRQAVNSGKTIYFGGIENTYRITSPIDITSPVRMLGTGATIKMETLEPFHAFQVTGIRIEGLIFDGMDIYFRVAEFNECENIDLRSNVFQNMGTAGQNGGNNSFVLFMSSRQILVESNIFRNAALSFIFLQSNCQDITFCNNHAYDCGNGTGVGLGVHADSPTGLTHNLVIADNRVYNSGFLCHVNGCAGLTITGNQIENCQNGIVVGYPREYNNGNESVRGSAVNISGNSITNSRDEAIISYGCDTLGISGNTIRDCELGLSVRHVNGLSIQGNVIEEVTSPGVGNANGRGMVLLSCRQAVIDGNTITRFFNHGILLDGGQDITVSNNIITNTSDMVDTGVGIALDSYGNPEPFNNIRSSGNQIAGVLHGFVARSGTKIEVRDNVITALEYGIQLNALDGFTLEDVRITGNKAISTTPKYALRVYALPSQGYGLADDVFIERNLLRGSNAGDINLVITGKGVVRDNLLSNGIAVDADYAGQIELIQSIQRVNASQENLSKLATMVLVDRTSISAVTIRLRWPFYGRRVIIKDSGFNAAVNNITLDGDGRNIDGQPSLSITQDGGSVELLFDGANWLTV